MGVVFKARQEGLDRLVALKVVLSGQFAGEAERDRFRTEALAVARLSHPNVVQVFEVGECQGHPYLTLEYVAGGSLADRLRAGPLQPRPAAELVERLARAVQAAHDKGVVHRDLKPANVLLAADGTPKLTDFGLAKRLDVEAGQTQSGAVLGTPSYMAPEQAAGKGEAVGPAADVYALGAILYELLTGRPPFQGPTTLETVLHVLADEPVPPSRFQPKTPRDLETICLKCLRKEPVRRYASAAELARDLGRFLSGEPIQARRVGRVERLWRWCQRKPLAAGLIAALVVSLLAGTAVSLVLLQTLQSRSRATAEAALRRGQGHMQRQEWDQAIADFSAAIRLDPDRADVWRSRAGANLAAGRHDEALADSITSLRLDPKLEEDYLTAAKACDDRGEYESALLIGTAILEANHRSVNAYLMQSHAHAMLCQWDRAAAAFAKAVALLPGFPKGSVEFSEVCRLLGTGDREGARKLCAHMVKRSAETKEAKEIYLIARMCVLAPDSGVDPGEAVRLAERAVKDEATAWYLHALGLAHYRAGQLDLAIEWLQKADQSIDWRGRPNNWLVLAMAHHRRGQADDARQWLSRARQNPVAYVHPHEAMAYQLLRHEAEELVLGAADGPKK
jgi:tetratricopeptide (TPR) repeat protein